MNKGDKVYVSKDGTNWYDAIFETRSVINGYFYVKGYDRGLSYCKPELDIEKDIYKGKFKHYELFFC